MKIIVIILILLGALALPVGAVEIGNAPEPEAGAELLPATQGDFVQDLWYVIRTAFQQIRPDIAEGTKLCTCLFGAVLLLAITENLCSISKKAVQLAGVVVISGLLISSANAMILLGANTVEQLSQYGKLLLPVMTGALAAQGAATTSAALYAGTVIFDSLLSSVIAKLLIPMVYIYVALSIGNVATGEDLLKKLRDMIKWVLVWTLKIILYVFIGYLGITGVVSGATDQMALKATKITISSAVPVVGSILADASEAVLISVGLMKNAAGIYGILAAIAIFVGPFLKIGVQYLFLKCTAFFCGVISGKENQELIDSFSTAMGFLLAMTGAVCLLQLISIVCFMKGVQG